MMEAGVVVDTKGEAIHWHLPPGRTGGSLPDSRSLWDVLWESRDRVFGFAHSHPGRGMPGPSHTDITTFVAIEKALGKRLRWWIITEDRVAITYPRNGAWVVDEVEPDQAWLVELRRLSYDEGGSHG